MDSADYGLKALAHACMKHGERSSPLIPYVPIFGLLEVACEASSRAARTGRSTIILHTHKMYAHIKHYDNYNHVTDSGHVTKITITDRSIRSGVEEAGHGHEAGSGREGLAKSKTMDF